MSSAKLTDFYPLLASGKVRELYTIDANKLLFVASDRLSAFDIVLDTPIPNKGKILTLLSVHWFKILSVAIPGLKHHFLTLNLPQDVQAVPGLASSLKGRSMQVRKLKILPIEAIVRGYITGSAWKEYSKSGTVNGLSVPAGLQESQQFPEPLYTPSTKAEVGQHDENISPAKAARLIGDEKVAARVAELAVQLYTAARDFAVQRGIIIADTKFEFGVDENNEVVLVDEVLTPDSSRFWPKDKYEVGKSQASFDKQGIRDWLTQQGLKGKEGVQIPTDVVEETEGKYVEAYEKLTGEKFV